MRAVGQGCTDADAQTTGAHAERTRTEHESAGRGQDRPPAGATVVGHRGWSGVIVIGLPAGVSAYQGPPSRNRPCPLAVPAVVSPA